MRDGQSICTWEGVGDNLTALSLLQWLSRVHPAVSIPGPQVYSRAEAETVCCGDAQVIENISLFSWY